MKIDEWMLKNNYFRGKKIKPDGKFLNIKGIRLGRHYTRPVGKR